VLSSHSSESRTLKRTGTNITLWGTIGTASILLWGFSQSEAKPEYSPPYIQIQTPPKPAQKAAIHIAPRLQSTSAKRHLHLAKDVTVKNLCKLHQYAVVEPREPAHRVASKDDEHDLGPSADLKVTPTIRDVLNKVRPKKITGIMNVEGKEYVFGSGGRGQSIPYGDYLITPDAVGSWGSKHGAIGVANGAIPDPKLHRDRDGIELHAATNSKLETDGCVSIGKDQWPEFRKQVLTMVREDKKVYLHVSDQGASVSTDPLGFIGETVSEPTFHDVLGLIEEPVRKAPETTPSSRCCRVARIKRKHTRDVGRTTRTHGHRVNRRPA
jgi:hypothetical protein